MTITCYPSDSDLLMDKSPCKMPLKVHQAPVSISWTVVNASSEKTSNFVHTCLHQRRKHQFFVGNDLIKQAQ